MPGSNKNWKDPTLQDKHLVEYVLGKTWLKYWNDMYVLKLRKRCVIVVKDLIKGVFAEKTYAILLFYAFIGFLLSLLKIRNRCLS